MGKIRELFARLFHGWARKVSRARSIKSRVAWVAAGIVPVLCACCFGLVAISPSESPAERAAPTEAEGGEMSTLLLGDIEPTALAATMESEIADLPAPTQEPRATMRPTRTATARPEPTDTIESTATEAAALTVTGTSAAEAPVVVVEPTTPPPTPAPEPTTSSPVSPTEVSAPPAEGPAPLPSAPGTGLIIVSVNKRDEYVDIQNVSEAVIDLAGWVLRSERGTQDCRLGGAIGAGEVMRIWAMSGAGGYSCGFDSNIWNNSEDDDAILINPQGQEAFRYDS